MQNEITENLKQGELGVNTFYFCFNITVFFGVSDTMWPVSKVIMSKFCMIYLLEQVQKPININLHTFHRQRESGT
jgi:hypothetical protein